jgi:hypothetical protein
VSEQEVGIDCSRSFFPRIACFTSFWVHQLTDHEQALNDTQVPSYTKLWRATDTLALD